MSTLLFLLIRSLWILRSSAYSFAVLCSPMWLMFVLFFNRSPYVQVYSSCLVPRRVLADSRATGILFRAGYHGKGEEKNAPCRLRFHWRRKVIYAKLEGKKKNHLECFLAKEKFTISSWRTKSPVHTILVKRTHSFSKEMAFLSIFVGTQMYVHGCKLARELGSY